MENTWNTPSVCFRMSTFEKLHKKVKCPYVFCLGCRKNRSFYPTWLLCFRSMAHLGCFIISRWAGIALNPSRKIHAFHSARTKKQKSAKQNRISAQAIIKVLTKTGIFLIFTWGSISTMFMTLNLNSTPCSVEADSRSCMGKQDNTGRINRKIVLMIFFLKLVSLMTIPTGLNFNLVDELNTNYAKFIRSFPPKPHYAVRIRNIRRNGLWSVPPILYFWKNGNIKRLFVKFVWSIITQY